MRSLITSLAFLLGAAAIPAQQAPRGSPPRPEAAALRTCTALADSGKGREAEPPGKTATSMYQARIARDPKDVEALVGAARAMSQCLVPSADFVRQGELSGEAIELLDRALEIQPDHWLARYVLASIAFRSPSFLGRGKRAAKEFDELLRMQGDRTENPMYARVYHYRGLQLSKAGAVDSARALWRRGAMLFPGDSALKALAASRDSVPAPPAPPPTPAAQPPLTTAPAPAAAPDTAISTTSLAGVQVVGTAAPSRPRLTSVKDVTRSQVLLSAGGAADVLQSIQMQPGATRVGEGGDVYTRGGDPGETSITVNGSRVLSLGRFEGLSGSLFGAIEPFVVKSVRYSSGGFSVRHGNVLSGVLEIETDGRPRERQTRAGLSLVQGSGTVRVPVNKILGAWLSSRISHTGPLLATHGRTGEFSGAPQSQEMIGSVIVTPTPFTEFRATAIVERDDSRRRLSAAGWRGTFDSRGDTRALMLNSRWVSSRVPLVVRASIAGNSRTNDWAFGVLSRDREESSALARADAEWEASPAVMLRFGAEHGVHSRVERGTVPTTSSVAPGSPVQAPGAVHDRSRQHGAYGETEFAVGGISLTAGLRGDLLPGESGMTVDPRIAISRTRGNWTSRLSGGVFHQGRWRGAPAIPDAGAPSGLPLTAQHLVAGLERETTQSLLRAEVFVKRYADYGPFGAGPAIDGTVVRGLDVIAQRTSGAVTGWVTYSLLDAASDLRTGERVRSPFDVTHTATGSVTATVHPDWSIGTTVRYGTGAPATPIVGAITDANERLQPRYGALMSERLPAYARLDARLMRYVRTPGFLLTTFAEVLNVTNRANVASVTYNASYSSREFVPTFFSKRTVVVGGEFTFR